MFNTKKINTMIASMNRVKRKRASITTLSLSLLPLISSVLISPIAYAGSTTGTTKATATLAKTCNISTGNVNFGNLAQQGSSPSIVWATGTVQTLCSKSTSYSIQLNVGNNLDANNFRRMAGASTGGFIQYTMCQTQSIDGVWGSTGGCLVPWRGTQYPVTSVGTGSNQTFTVYAASQTGYYAPDNYADTIVATIVY